MTKFVHLHLHTEYSLLDGLSKIKRLFSYVKEKKMDAVAITDHGAMYGAIDFFKEGKKQEVKPIIGMEAYMTNFPLDDEKKVKDNYHLTLLAKDYQGYKNLMNLTSIAHLKGYYYRPRFTKDILEKYSKGIICLSGCPQAEVPQYLINGEFKKAKETTEWFLKVFGKDYFLEIQRHSFDKILPSIKVPELKESLSQIADNYVVYEKGIVKLSRELGIPLVATNDAHYIKKEDAEAQDALVCIATGKNTSDIKRMRYIDNPDFFIKDPEEMQKMFPDYPDALENTVKIAEKCNLEIPLGSWSFPKFNLPEGLTDKKYIEKLAWEKLPIKLGKEAEERLTHELDIINNKGYAPYFLIVMDMVNWCGSQGIITNTRGSAAGSLVSYVLGITTVNPLTYGLPFERFLNPYRPSPPDIDFDVSDNRREEVLKYIADTYGVEKTAQICTFGRMLAKAAVRDVARVLGYPYITGDKVAKLIPLGSQGFPMTIDRALNETPDLKTLYDNDADTKKIIDLARQVEGNARHLSVHAAGVVVAPSNLTDFAPIQREPSGEKIITQYEMHACEDVGLIKFDILGIRNLSILGSAIQIVKKQKEIDINLLNLPLNDKKTFEMLSRGETMGTFQLNGSGMTKFLKDLKPARIEDLMAMVALYRPGPMAVIPEYIARKNNHKLIKYLDPRMEKFLKMSYGLIVYQDDLLFCALDLAGYTWEEADKFRKAVGKKIPEEMAAQKEKFIKGIIEHGQTQKFAEKLWTLFEPFQAYGFNKAHAASYGMVAYYTSYMKANYPIEYMTALLTAESDDSDKISAAVHECRRMKINVLPPDINESDVDFSIVDGAIRFGLSAIKNVGNVAIQIILEARQDGPFNSFSDFINRVDARKVNKKVLESLIKVGAMQKFGKRTALLASVDEIKSKLVKPKENNGQSGLFSEEDSLKTSAIVNDVSFIDNTIPEYTEDEIQNLERELLGFSLSGKPINELLEKLELQATHKIFELNPDEQRGKIVKVAVVVREVRKILTKKSNAEMAFVKVEDTTGILDLVVFPKIFQETKDHWVDGKPLIICGKVDSREDTTNMLVDSISLGEIDNSIVIKIPKTIGKDELLMLKQIFQENPGDIETTLLFEKDNRKIKPKLKIKWSDNLSKQISEILKQNL